MAQWEAGDAALAPDAGSGSDAIPLARGLFLAGLIYPAWYLLAPSPAVDSWWVWCAVAAAMLLPQTLCALVPAARRHRRALCHLAIGAMTLQFFALASLNDMQSFYAVASVLMAVNGGVTCATPRALLGFGAYVSVLILVSILLDPHSLKVAYWSSVPIVLSFLYWQLHRRWRAEAEVQRYQGQLERRVDERTRELRRRTQDLEAINTRLNHEIAERERAEESLRTWQKLEALSRLVGGVAHDFNNLTTAINGYATLLRDSLPPGSPQRGDADEICHAAQRAADLTRHLLSFSRRSPLETGVLDLNQAVRESEDLLSLVCGAEVKLRLDLGPGALWIRANRTQIDQVLLNLAHNARDAMPAGGSLTIETRGLPAAGAGEERLPAGFPPGARVRIRVRDTGIGMDPITASRVFDPFFTTKDVDTGTGLGLAAVYGIVQQSRGSIDVETAPGLGACFTIHWPAAEPESAVERPAMLSAAAAPDPARREQHILVVDDEAPLRRLVSRILEDHGYAVSCAEDAEHALDEVQRPATPIDLVLTDVVLPRISGIQLAQQVAKLRPEVRILFMSGHLGHASLATRELPVGAPLLAKPFPPDTLLAKVRDVLCAPSAGP
jgi:signal transduction histidine kinase/CheY-like chemotaxis protein